MVHAAETGGIARPPVTVSDAVQIARDRYGLDAVATELGSNQDRNYLLEATDGTRAVLRIDNASVTDADRSIQHEAIDACTRAGIPVPALLPGLDGNVAQRLGDYTARLSAFVPGEAMVDIGYFAPTVMRGFGALAARSVLALQSLQGAAFDRVHQWDMRRAYDETVKITGAITDSVLRNRVHDTARVADAALARVAPDLPTQVIHGDLTDDNALGERRADSRVHPHTLIDFGDLGTGWRVAEIAVTVSSLLHHVSRDPLRVLDAIEEHQRVLTRAGDPLSEPEVRALWPLVMLRASLLIASGWRQLELEGDNEYVRERMPGEQEIFDTATTYALEEMTEQILARLEFDAPDNAELRGSAEEPLRALLPGLLGHVTLLDPGVESEALAHGKWLEYDAETQLAATALSEGAGAAVFPYGVFRLTRTTVDVPSAPATFPIFTEIVTASSPETLAVTAPVDGTVTAVHESHVALSVAGGWALVIDGMTPVPGLQQGANLAAGDPLGELAGTRILVALRAHATGLDGSHHVLAEPFVSGERAPGVARLWADPAELIGLESFEQRDESADEQTRRERIFAAAQERYYEHPMQVERGWRHHLIDTTGRAYIDVVNNVTGLGHGHPAVADAVNRQMRTLGTNSRFLYRSLAEYSERLLALLPESADDQEPLDTVLLVNSGSEAVDLAIRLAQAASGRQTIVALREAYHGWTLASDAVTTSAFDNPHALESRPDWVHVADVPNTYRGTHRGEGAAERYLADLEHDVRHLAAEGRDVGGFICESVLGNAGGVVLPDGYLAGAYEMIRAAGGVVIADEVQVGFGRMGSTFWGFEQSGVMPDIITIAKPMGNGFPIGGVITSKRIADALASEGQFFSSAGGNPVSCAAGLAVLDTMVAEGLQENARVVGHYLATGFATLRDRHDLIGPIHGEGLYLGVELVRDHETLEPAAAEADAICERLRELGVIVLTTSERSNVLKIKPPLCLTIESADAVLSALDRVFTEGW